MNATPLTRKPALSRRRWPLCAGLLATALVATTVANDAWRVGATSSETGSGSMLVQIAPCRITDSRPESQIGPRATPLGQRDRHVVEAHGTNGECQIPTDAVGLSLNVTMVDATAQTYITIWGGGDQPLASSLNPGPGQPPTPNAVATPLDENGAFSMYNHNGSVHAVVDVNGYYRVPDAATDADVIALVDQHAADLAVQQNKLAAQQAELDGLRSDAEKLTSGLDAALGRITALETSRPAVFSDREDVTSLLNSPQEVVAVRFTAPSAGHVVVSASGWILGLRAERSASCSVSDSSFFHNNPYRLYFRAAIDEQLGTLVGHRVFEVEAGENVRATWVCSRS
ncbi:MAG: hypothetical protein AAFY28_10145, partial [Actinomycetota bacterium]